MQLVAFLDVQLVNGLAEKVIVPGPRAIQHADDTQQRRLPGARRAHDGHKFPGLDIQIDAPQQKEFVRASLDCLFETSQLNQRFHVSSLRFERRSEEHTSELQSRLHLVCRLLLEKKNKYVHSNTQCITLYT